jgi:hypothetical protein
MSAQQASRPASEGTSAPSAGALAAGIRVTSGSPTPVELAAVTAVVVAAVEELAQEDRRRDVARPSAWERSRRGVRRPLVRGAWSTFGRI